MISGSAARNADLSAVGAIQDNQPDAPRATVAALRPLKVLMVVPSLQPGAAETGALDLVRMLGATGHRAIVMSAGGPLEAELAEAGGEHIAANLASKNPLMIARNAAKIAKVARLRGCDIIHAHGRAPAWSAFAAARLTRLPFVTSWYKGFREQHALKRLYNSVMARGDRIVAASDQLADLISERYGIPSERIQIVPPSIDVARFDRAAVSADRVDAIRRIFGVGEHEKVVLSVGRLLRRKGHHVAIRAARRLKDMGVKDFVFLFVGEDAGRSRYGGELWDEVVTHDLADVVRLVGPVDDMPAAYATASVVISAATQAEGLQRAVLEAQAMERPVVVSDLSAGPDAVLAPPAVSDDRITGFRFSAGDDSALAAALVKLFSLAPPQQRAIGLRGRQWVCSNFSRAPGQDVARRLYSGLPRRGTR